MRSSLSLSFALVASMLISVAAANAQQKELANVGYAGLL